MAKTFQNGISLIEILMVLAILATLSTLTIANLNLWLTQLEQELAMRQLKRAIEFAKNEAHQSQKTISLCPSTDQKYCYIKDDWSTGYIIFENPERETQPKPNSIIKVYHKSSYGKIIFNAPGNELHIHPDNSTTNIGTFSYCAKNKKVTSRITLVINWAARCYLDQKKIPAHFSDPCKE